MTASPEPHVASQRVLVVDDEALNRMLMTAMLELLGCRVEEAASGAEAWETLKRQPFDRLFLDLRMPGMSGIELAAQLRAVPGCNRQVPIVAVSGDCSRSLAQYAQIGFDGAVEKPVCLSALRASLQTLRHVNGRAAQA